MAAGVGMNKKIWRLLAKMLSTCQLQQLGEEYEKVTSGGYGEPPAPPEFLMNSDLSELLSCLRF